MKLVKRERGVNELDFPRAFTRLWEDFWNESLSMFGRMEEDSIVWAPRMDVEETDDAYIIHADLPGIDKKNLHISLQDNVLTIKGERKYEEKKETKNHFQLERAYGNFYRTITLPEKVKEEEIKAKYKDGVLTITLPKSEEAKPKMIEIQ